MKIIVTKDYAEMSKKAYELIRDVMLAKPNCILGLATGSTPIGLYDNLIAGVKNNEITFKNVKTVNLDEYVNLPRAHKESYFSFMHEKLFNKVDILEENINLPFGAFGDMNKNCDEYNELLGKMRQDIQVLGIGGNGHIGFNEPNTSFKSVTHIVDLTENTRKDNARFFENDVDNVPTQAITMGIQNIMDAKCVIILISGAGKAAAAKAMIEGACDPICPASALQNHKNVIVVIDEAAATLLNKKNLNN